MNEELKRWGQHESKGRLIGQRRRGDFLRNAETGARAMAELPVPLRSPEGLPNIIIRCSIGAAVCVHTSAT